jgi:hypothetical protein
MLYCIFFLFVLFIVFWKRSLPNLCHATLQLNSTPALQAVECHAESITVIVTVALPHCASRSCFHALIIGVLIPLFLSNIVRAFYYQQPPSSNPLTQTQAVTEQEEKRESGSLIRFASEPDKFLSRLQTLWAAVGCMLDLDPHDLGTHSLRCCL